MDNNNLQNYFRGQQVSLQWLPVMRAMAAEMSAHTNAKDLRALFFRIGQRFAKDTEEIFQEVQSLAQLEDSLNDFWARINWGWVTFTEENGFVDIDHQAAPLAEAFGDDALAWSIGLLEGYYQSVFRMLGASDSMIASSVKEMCKGMDVRLHFRRQD